MNQLPPDSPWLLALGHLERRTTFGSENHTVGRLWRRILAVSKYRWSALGRDVATPPTNAIERLATPVQLALTFESDLLRAEDTTVLAKETL